MPCLQIRSRHIGGDIQPLKEEPTTEESEEAVKLLSTPDAQNINAAAFSTDESIRAAGPTGTPEASAQEFVTSKTADGSNSGGGSNGRKPSTTLPPLSCFKRHGRILLYPSQRTTPVQRRMLHLLLRTIRRAFQAASNVRWTRRSLTMSKTLTCCVYPRVRPFVQVEY